MFVGCSEINLTVIVKHVQIIGIIRVFLSIWEDLLGFPVPGATAIPLAKETDVAIPLAKNVLAPLGITAASSAIDAGIRKKIQGSGTTNLIISKEEINGIVKVVQALGDSKILLKGVTKTIKNEIKEQKGGFLSMLLGTLGASLLGNLLAGKEIVRAGSGNKKGKGIVRAGTGKQ